MSDHAAKGIQQLTLGEQARLAGILSMLSSPFDNERATAGLMATAFIAKHDLMWSDLTELLHPIPHPPLAASTDPQPRRNRRRGKNPGWRGYSRRRLLEFGLALDLFA